MPARIDLTGYSDSELSLHVFNDEYLYRQRHKNSLGETLDQLYIYTPEQYQELLQDLEDDLQADL